MEVAALRTQVQVGNGEIGEVKGKLLEEKRTLKRSCAKWQAHLDKAAADLEVAKRKTARQETHKINCIETNSFICFTAFALAYAVLEQRLRCKHVLKRNLNQLWFLCGWCVWGGVLPTPLPDIWIRQVCIRRCVINMELVVPTDSAYFLMICHVYDATPLGVSFVSEPLDCVPDEETTKAVR